MFKKFVAIALTTALSMPAFAQTRSTNPSGFSGSNTYNVRIAPLSLLVGGVNLSFDMAVTPEWTIGPTFTYLNWTIKSGTGNLSNDLTLKASSLGARANWYRNGVHTDGLYLAPGLSYVTASASSGTESGELSVMVLSGMVGYGWFWDSFNILLGAGLGVPLGASKIQVKNSSNGTTREETYTASGSGGLEFTTGWTF